MICKRQIPHVQTKPMFHYPELLHIPLPLMITDILKTL